MGASKHGGVFSCFGARHLPPEEMPDTVCVGTSQPTTAAALRAAAVRARRQRPAAARRRRTDGDGATTMPKADPSAEADGGVGFFVPSHLPAGMMRWTPTVRQGMLRRAAAVVASLAVRRDSALWWFRRTGTRKEKDGWTQRHHHAAHSQPPQRRRVSNSGEVGETKRRGNNMIHRFRQNFGQVNGQARPFRQGTSLC